MQTTNYYKGRSFEYRIKNQLKAAGCYVIRSAGSHSHWDLVAISNKYVLLIQCKKSKSKSSKSVYSTFQKLLHSFNFPNFIIPCLVFSNKKTIKILYNFSCVIFECDFQNFLKGLKENKPICQIS